MKLVIMVYLFDNLYKNDKENFLIFMNKLYDQSNDLKVILIHNKSGDDQTFESNMRIMNLKIKPLSKEDSIDMIYYMNRDIVDASLRDFL